MNVVDTPAWLEYFAEGPNAGFFAPAIEATADLLVPTVVLQKVFRRILQDRGEGEALQAAAVLHQGRMVDLDAALALAAAKLSAQTGLPSGESIVLATARRFGALVWTTEKALDGHPDVRYRSRRR